MKSAAVTGSGIFVLGPPLARGAPCFSSSKTGKPRSYAQLVAWVGEDSAGREGDPLRDNEAKVAAHLRRLDPDDIETLAVLATSSNFLMREAAAVFMVAHARRASN